MQDVGNEVEERSLTRVCLVHLDGRPWEGQRWRGLTSPRISGSGQGISSWQWRLAGHWDRIKPVRRGRPVKTVLGTVESRATVTGPLDYGHRRLHAKCNSWRRHAVVELLHQRAVFISN